MSRVRISPIRRLPTLALVSLAAFPFLRLYGQSVAKPSAKNAKKHHKTESIEMTLQRSVPAKIKKEVGKGPANCRIDVPEAVSIDEVGDAIQGELQNLDFAVDSPENKTVLDPISKGASDEQEHWTDVVELTLEVLKNSGTTLQELGLKQEGRIYGYQVAVRWTTKVEEPKQSFVVPCGSSPGVPGSPGPQHAIIPRTVTSPRTVVKLKISVIIYERGKDSEFVERSSHYEPKPLRKWVEKHFSDALNGLNTATTV